MYQGFPVVPVTLWDLQVVSKAIASTGFKPEWDYSTDEAVKAWTAGTTDKDVPTKDKLPILYELAYKDMFRHRIYYEREPTPTSESESSDEDVAGPSRNCRSRNIVRDNDDDEVGTMRNTPDPGPSLDRPASRRSDGEDPGSDGIFDGDAPHNSSSNNTRELLIKSPKWHQLSDRPRMPPIPPWRRNAVAPRKTAPNRAQLHVKPPNHVPQLSFRRERGESEDRQSLLGNRSESPMDSYHGMDSYNDEPASQGHHSVREKNDDREATKHTSPQGIIPEQSPRDKSPTEEGDLQDAGETCDKSSPVPDDAGGFRHSPCFANGVRDGSIVDTGIPRSKVQRQQLNDVFTAKTPITVSRVSLRQCREAN
ncbi:hypothetical protein BFJ66_g3822 [Fusarium oxysporum f. sp. cepae]|nr:hypothetical protein BFJ66_g3822 [Fusarium oxysporum f. sp. cepae]